MSSLIRLIRPLIRQAIRPNISKNVKHPIRYMATNINNNINSKIDNNDKNKKKTDDDDDDIPIITNSFAQPYNPLLTPHNPLSPFYNNPLLTSHPVSNISASNDTSSNDGYDVGDGDSD